MRTIEAVKNAGEAGAQDVDEMVSPKISVVIPTMNEPAISKVIDDVRQALKHFDYEIIVIDNSLDDTARRARKAGATVVRQEGVGYGNAYLLGFKKISPDADIVVMLDGDYTYDAFEIPLLIDPIIGGKADMVLGSRFAHMEEGAMNRRNRFGNRIITGFINTLYRLKLKDSQTGFRAIRATAMRSMEISSDGMPFASEMIIDARKKSMSIVEVPVRYRLRVGEPKLKAYKDGSLIISLVIRMVRDYNPLMIFLPAGSLMLLVAMILGITVVLEWLQTGQVIFIARAILTALLFMTGMQIIFFGLLADIILVALRSRR